MAFTQTQLNTLDAAIASGTLIVQLDGKKVQYQNMADLIRARDLIRNELASASGRPRETTVLTEFYRD